MFEICIYIFFLIVWGDQKCIYFRIYIGKTDFTTNYKEILKVASHIIKIPNMAKVVKIYVWVFILFFYLINLFSLST